MKIESINKEVQEKVMQLLNDAPAEKKAEAIILSRERLIRLKDSSILIGNYQK